MNEKEPNGAEQTIYTRIKGFPEVPKELTHPADKIVSNGTKLREELLEALSQQADPDESSTLGGSRGQQPDSEID